MSIDQIISETTSLLEKINALTVILANLPEAPEDLLSAADALRIKADTVDRLIKDLGPPSQTAGSE